MRLQIAQQRLARQTANPHLLFLWSSRSCSSHVDTLPHSDLFVLFVACSTLANVLFSSRGSWSLSCLGYPVLNCGCGKVTSIYNDVLNDPEVAANPGNVSRWIDRLQPKLIPLGMQVAGYIPQLANTPHAEAWGVSICTVDGQRFSVGDVDIPFCVQSSSKPVTYCMGVRDHGHEYVHSHVGCEPSGVPFNEIVLNKRCVFVCWSCWLA